MLFYMKASCLTFSNCDIRYWKIWLRARSFVVCRLSDPCPWFGLVWSSKPQFIHRRLGKWDPKISEDWFAKWEAFNLADNFSRLYLHDGWVFKASNLQRWIKEIDSRWRYWETTNIWRKLLIMIRLLCWLNNKFQISHTMNLIKKNSIHWSLNPEKLTSSESVKVWLEFDLMRFVPETKKKSWVNNSLLLKQRHLWNVSSISSRVPFVQTHQWKIFWHTQVQYVVHTQFAIYVEHGFWNKHPCMSSRSICRVSCVISVHIYQLYTIFTLK